MLLKGLEGEKEASQRRDKEKPSSDGRWNGHAIHSGTSTTFFQIFQPQIWNYFEKDLNFGKMFNSALKKLMLNQTSWSQFVQVWKLCCKVIWLCLWLLRNINLFWSWQEHMFLLFHTVGSDRKNKCIHKKIEEWTAEENTDRLETVIDWIETDL